MGYSLRGHRELDVTEQVSTARCIYVNFTSQCIPPPPFLLCAHLSIPYACVSLPALDVGAEGADIGIHVTDSLCSAAETNTTL